MHRSSRFSHYENCPGKDKHEKAEAALNNLLQQQTDLLIEEIYAWFKTKHGRFAIYLAERERNGS